MKIVGIGLIIIGIFMLVFRGYTFTQEKKVGELGPIELNKQQEKTVKWPLYAGLIVAGAGVVLFAAGARRAKN